MTWRCGMCRCEFSGPARTCTACRADIQKRLADQPTLFDAARPGDVRRTDPLPSKRAAAANLSARQSQKKQILKRFLLGDQTSRSVADITGGQVSRASKRLGELRDDELIRAIGFEWQPSGGTPVTVYRITDAGLRDAELMTQGVA